MGMDGGPPGDLYVLVSVQPHRVFGREGTNVLYELPLNIAQAALGAEVDVPTVDGKARLKVPAGTQSGTVFKVKGKGFGNLRSGGRGDELVQVSVVTPRRLNDKERKLLQELAESLGGAVGGPEGR